ncbi:MAG: hypothetical protein ACYCQI_12135 [Gammaproteobacteria bacterium]
MLHNKSLFKPKAISAELVDINYLRPLAEIVQSLVSHEDHLSAVLKSDKKLPEKIDYIAGYLFEIIKEDNNFDVDGTLKSACSFKPDMYDIIKRFLKHWGKAPVAQCVDAYWKASLLTPSSQYEEREEIKYLIHELIESNNYMALELLFRKNSRETLKGEWTRNFKHRALDGVSKISNIDLAIKLGHAESLAVLLKYEDQILWPSGSGNKQIYTTLDYAVAFAGGEHAVDCVRLLVVAYLKELLLSGRKEALGKEAQKPGTQKSVKQYHDEKGSIITLEGFSRAKFLAEKQGKKALVEIIDKALALISLPLDQFESALEKFGTEAIPEEKPTVITLRV